MEGADLARASGQRTLIGDALRITRMRPVGSLRLNARQPHVKVGFAPHAKARTSPGNQLRNRTQARRPGLAANATKDL